jgi:hypothetical protein
LFEDSGSAVGPPHYVALLTGRNQMPAGFWLLIAFIVLVFAYVISKVLYYKRKSDEQWQAVDKSKLREWEDD